MGKHVKPSGIAEALGDELTTYHKEIIEKVNAAGSEAVKKLVKITKATAPKGERGSYKKNITSKEFKSSRGRGSTYVWYVKPPDHRLTHLLVHGHATRNGKRTKANPFLQNALESVLPEYEDAVKEAIEK